MRAERPSPYTFASFGIPRSQTPVWERPPRNSRFASVPARCAKRSFADDRAQTGVWARELYAECAPNDRRPTPSPVSASLVPKLLFGNALRETPVSRPSPRGARNGVSRMTVPKQEFGHESCMQNARRTTVALHLRQFRHPSFPNSCLGTPSAKLPFRVRPRAVRETEFR